MGKQYNENYCKIKIVQFYLGYPTTLGLAPIRISEFAGYGSYAENTASLAGFIHILMYLLIAIVYVTNYCLNIKWIRLK